MVRFNPLPHLTSALVVVIAFATIAAAQTILPSAASATFPQCALSCSQLIEAQNNCLPPAAPVTNQATYNSCFCQSGLLAQLRISPDGTCDAFCPAESDRQLLQSWYKSYCAAGTTSITTAVTTSTSALPDPSTVTSGVTTVIVIINPSSSSISSASPITTGSGTTVGTTSSSNKSWYGIDAHWRWILMLGILLVGLGLVAFLAVCLKRRHRRKLEEKRASLSGFRPAPPSGRNRTPTPSLGPELWGPHQHMAHTHGWEYSHEQDSTAVSDGALGSRKKSKKIRRDPSEKGGSRGGRRMSGDVPGVLSDMAKIQRRREREQEKERERTRDVYADHRAQSMRGALTALERDRENQPRSQTMRERDRVAWQDPEKAGHV